MFFTSK